MSCLACGTECNGMYCKDCYDKAIHEYENNSYENKILQRREQFLKELAALTVKYGVIIDGCGCCGSPFVYGLETTGNTDENSGDKLEWDEEKKEYKIDWDVKLDGE